MDFIDTPASVVMERAFNGIAMMMIFSVVLAVLLKVVYKTRLYNQYIGDGVNGSPSKWFSGTNPKLWISMAAGVWVAVSYNLNIFFQIGGTTDFAYMVALGAYDPGSPFVQVAPNMSNLGMRIWLHEWLFPGWLNILGYQILTGLGISGGASVWVGMAKQIGKSFKAISEAFDKKVNGKTE